MSLTSLPLRRPVTTLMLLLSLMVLGTVALFKLPLDFMPVIQEPEIDLEVPFPGSHPLETLRDVVEPLEAEVATIADIRSIESRASSGSGQIEIRFDWGVPIDVKKMEVREAIERARPLLPETIGHIRVEGDIGGPAEGSVLQGRISAERDLSESWELLEQRIQRPLERIQGVAQVSLYGVGEQQVRVDLDLDALRRHGVEPGDVLSAINGSSRDVDAGAVRGGLVRYDVRTASRFRSAADIAALRLGRGGVTIGDVAQVQLREPELDHGRHLDRAFAIGIDVFKEPSANTVEVVDALMERIAEVERDPQLEGVTLLVWNNAGEEIRRSLLGLRNAGLFGGLLAIAVLHFFLRRVRSTMVVAVAIPFSLLVTCGAMFALGSQLDVLTLLGLMLGVGMLVDNAVVVIENIHRYEGLGLEPAQAAEIGVRQVALAVVASTATTVCVWSWLFVAERNEMVIMMGAVALTICLAVGCSLLISLTFIPLAAVHFAPREPSKPGFVLRRLVPGYQRALNWTLDHRMLTLAVLFTLAGSALWPLAKLEKSGEPRMQGRNVPIFIRVHDPVTVETMEGYVDVVEDWLFGRRDELGFDSVYSYYSDRGWGMTSVYLPEGSGPEQLAELRGKLRIGLPVIPGVRLEVGDRDRWRSHGGQDRRMVSVSLHGEDPEYLAELAAEVEDRLRGLDHLEEIWGPSLEGQKEARIAVDPEAAHRLGVSPRAVADVVSFAFRGRRLARFQGADGEVEMLMGLPEEARPGLDALADLPVMTGDGRTVPLSSVARIELQRMPEEIRRSDRQTTNRVVAQFDQEAVTTEQARQAVAERLQGFHLPEGYGWDFGSWGRDQDDTLQTMTHGVVLSLAVVILLMAALFESFTQPFAILVTLLLAFFGAFWALWLFDYTLDAVAFTGIIILIGIVVNNGIVMVDHVNHLRREGRPRRQALLEGCGDRLRPVLMTAITTIFGLLPLAVSSATVASAYIDSIAVAVIGGLTTSTVFTLLALPVWYSTLEDTAAFVARLLPRRTIAPDTSLAA